MTSKIEQLGRFALVSAVALAAFAATPAAAESQLGTKRYIGTQQPRETVTQPKKPGKAVKQESAIRGAGSDANGTFVVPRRDLDRLYQDEGYRLGR